MLDSTRSKKYATFYYNHLYQLRLQDDTELLAKAETVYSAQHLISKNHTLDSALFGATLMNPICDICRQRVEDCVGHFAVIQLPFPIIRSICLKDFKVIITSICPICSHFLLPDIKNALQLSPEYRLAWIKKEVDKFTKSGENCVVCPTCARKVTTIKLLQAEPCLRICITSPQQNLQDQLNPITMYTILQNFMEQEEAGFSPNYHPKNFMTNLIPIIPNKLRPKTITSSESTLTSYYRVIIEEICPELNKLYKTLSLGKGVIIDKGDLLNNFNKYYDKLMAYYLLITDMGTDRSKEAALNLIEKRDRKHVDDHNPLICRFKGKEKSIWAKGIIDTRVNVSGRTVLGGATDTSVISINVPYHISDKLSMLYPVYAQNINAMKQLVAAMSDTDIVHNIHVPHVLGIVNGITGKLSKVTIKDALTKASLLKPGDKLSISLITSDFVMHSRFPSIREESWSSFQLKKDDNTIITMPLSTCALKMADFDGDESQIYATSSHYTDVESLLLHSTYTQFIQYKDGGCGVWYSADAKYGIPKIKPNAKSIIYNGKFNYPELDVIKTVESYLPEGLDYKDAKTEIVNGKFVSDKTNLLNVELHKYINSLYGNEVVCNFMDKVIQLSYDLNRHHGNTLGFEIRICGDDVKKEIKRLIAEGYKQMCLTEQSNDPHKDTLQILATDKYKSKVKKLLIDSLNIPNVVDLNSVKSLQEEYYQIVVMLDHVVIEGERIQNILAEGSRTCCSYPRYSVDPCAYGYIKCGYCDDVSPVSHMFECKQQRFALFQKGQGTAKQGYMSKRLGVTYGSNYADFSGALVDNFRIISTQYGSSGLNPRLYVVQPLIDIQLDPKSFEKQYGADKRLIELYNKLHEYRSIYARLTAFTRSDTIKNVFAAGFNYEQYINTHSSGTKSEGMTVKEIDAFVDRLRNAYLPPGITDTYQLENFCQHEYYFRVKLANVKLSEKVMNKIYDMYIWSLVDGGDPVGVKASLATSEPLTQASLHAIHSAGGGGASAEHLKRTAGLTRFEELLGGNNPRYTVVTFKLYDDSKDAALEFANEQETFYFNNIWTRLELGISKRIPQKVLDLTPNIPLSELDINPYYITSIWNMIEISSYHIHVVDIINRLVENFSEIMFITGYILNKSEFMAYIYFKPTVKVEQINLLMEEWAMERPSTIVHGKYLRNCYVSENKNRPGHFIIEANEVSPNSLAIQNLIFDERVDPCGCRTTDPAVNQKMFGIGEASTRQYEELIYTATNLSVTSGILQRHYKVLADATFAGGEPLYASRNSLKHDRCMDTMRLVQFETAKDMIQQALKYGDVQPVADPVSAAVFGELPTSGTGVSKVNFYSV